MAVAHDRVEVALDQTLAYVRSKVVRIELDGSGG